MELIIYDAEISNAAEFCNKTGSELEILLYKYIIILNSIKNNALTKGAAADRLGAYISYASKMLGDLGQISLDVKICLNKYLEEVDKADQYLF